VLHYFGLPVGEDMEGRVLEDVFTERRPVETLPTWENPDAPRQTRAESGPDADKALLEQFVALGYIDEIPDDPGQAKAETERENDWNMARACMYGQRYEMALPLLEACYHAQPARTDYAQVLATCQLQLGLLDEADATIARAAETFGRTEQADLIKASIAIQKKDFSGALAALEKVREKNPAELQLQLMLAQSYLALRQWENAESAARQVLTIDLHNPQAFLTLARIQLHSERAAEAVESALEAIGFQYGNPLGHFLLGAALVQLENFAQAERPLLNCLRLAPKFVRAQRLLARVYRHLGQTDKASICEMQSHKILLEEKIQARDKLAALRESTDARAAVRTREDAAKQAEAERRKAEFDAIEPLDFLIVSGLPRSGTSLMMQILQAGSIPLMADGQRTADEDNPEGYHEWEDIKKLAKNPRLIEPAAGKAVKVISALLPSLPGMHRYKILYMVRPTAQVVDSQWAMLARQGKMPKSEKTHLIEVQESHSRNIREVLKKSDRVEMLEIDYPELVADPQATLARVADFLGESFTLGPKVEACIKPALHRQRTGFSF